MIMPIHGLDKFIVDDWRARWVRQGMICVQDLTRPKDRQSWELKHNGLPDRVDAVGCGGWDEDGTLHWVGIDLDVGHGNAYAETSDAVHAALKIRHFVGNAAEIRLSKSGSGVHVRIAIGGNVPHGRKNARCIAWWIAQQLSLKCDNAVLGRQNLWFWAANTNPKSFELVEECEGEWTPPAEAMQEPVRKVTAPVPPVMKPHAIQDRAWKYLQKIPGAVSGQDGHKATFHAACVLVLGFNLSVADARPLLVQWNATCTPPWSEKELEHKLAEADRKNDERGYLLKPDAPTQPAPIVPTAATGNVSATLFQQFKDEISGKRYACDWPWHYTTSLTEALLPQTVTLLPAPKGSSKSFFVIQAAQFWQNNGYNPAVLMLEEDRTFHLRRALAQYVENGNLSSPKWVKENQDEIARYERNNAKWVEQFGKCIHEVNGSISTNGVLDWLEHVAKDSRVVVVDPITVRDASDKPWIDDSKFIKGAKQIMRKYEASLVLTCHPPKTLGKDKQTGAKSWGDDVAGGAALQNLASNILFLEYMPEAQSVEVGTMAGRAQAFINRRLQLRKTRSAGGQGHTIGFFFNGKTLKLEERGLL